MFMDDWRSTISLTVSLRVCLLTLTLNHRDCGTIYVKQNANLKYYIQNPSTYYMYLDMKYIYIISAHFMI